jgi:N-acetylglucosaminyl-diphospho-decaprenol L-rhamnosyltransferase
LTARTCCLMVLNYNGQKHLNDCLHSVLNAVKCFGAPCPVIVVDNRSTENDVFYIRSHFPQVEVKVAERNDFLFSLNKMVAQCSEDIVIILNNDMRFEPSFIGPLLSHFEDFDVFAVMAKVMNWEGTYVSSGKRVGYFRNFWFYKYLEHEKQEACFTLDAGGGCSAYHRERFVELGGFDPLYRPAYWEDTDLSYRAWQKGWKVIYEPASVMYHRIGGTLNELYGRSKMTRLISKNGVLFTIRNCGGFFFLLGFLFLLPLRFFRSYWSGNKPLAYGILDAIPKIPLAFKKKWASIHLRRVSDKIFLERIRNGRGIF